MANGIGWKTLELQIENLIPGILLSAELIGVIPKLSVLIKDQTNLFVIATVFIATSYALGLISSLVSRMIIDWISERGPRCWVFDKFVHGKRSDLISYFTGIDLRFKDDHEMEKEKRRSTIVADWNAIYRSALRTTNRTEEVDRRRAQGRVVRNLFLPILFAPLLAVKALEVSCDWFIIIVLMAVGFAVSILLYSYAELINLAEAHDISQIKKTKNDKSQNKDTEKENKKT